MRLISFSVLLMAVASIPVMAQQGTGYLKTKVNPGRAGVFIDGKYVGPAGNFGIGRKYTVAAGEHEIKLCEPRYEDVVTKVTIQPGKTTKLSQTMKALPLAKPPFGRLRTISSDKFAAVYVNDKYMGHADEFSNSAQGLLLNPGEYTVKVVPLSGGQEKEEKVKITADQVTIVRAGK
ncbi:MAG: PEGA domain-containing protein [Bryobacteraceae bacterium]